MYTCAMCSENYCKKGELGLCVGHDTLFIRVLGHNPLAVIYQAESYYKNKLFPQK
ncbi:DUF1847 domain-containing protein [Metaclostridioides mangenotii]|uniref:Metal-binding protein n=1 Tax=Metaclostridioides mangenotii TaxID=1540 RepID=A0ABS4E7U1_9FIRM|nr:putative metal-binding protein [Clostridioides mangenotii]